MGGGEVAALVGKQLGVGATGANMADVGGRTLAQQLR